MISQMPMPDTAKIDAEAGASRNGSRRPTVAAAASISPELSDRPRRHQMEPANQRVNLVDPVISCARISASMIPARPDELSTTSLRSPRRSKRRAPASADQASTFPRVHRRRRFASSLFRQENGMFRALITLAPILLIASGARSPVFDWSPGVSV